MVKTKLQKETKRIIDSQYLKYIQSCFRTGENALPPEEWFEKKFKKGELIR